MRPLAAILILALCGCGPVRDDGVSANGYHRYTVHPDCLDAEAAAIGWRQPFATQVEQIIDVRRAEIRTAPNMRPWHEGRQGAIIMADARMPAYVITYRMHWERFTPAAMDADATLSGSPFDGSSGVGGEISLAADASWNH